ncbi:MAG: pyridoxal phosphate-dependent aminotransferase [Defluviitaleaceae bacterium]|nr:pyridoxal phosphate-dependent aminotransferase [Defluviitaleaceae bacterium]
MKALSTKALQVKESSTLAITAKAKALKASGEDLIAFTAGEPDFDTPNHIKEAAFQAAKDGFTKYTATPGIVEVRKAICEKLKKDNGLDYEPSQIIVSNGAKHALANVFTAIINDGDEIIFPAPYWLTYPELAALAGGVSKIVMTDKSTGYKPTVEQIKSAITSKTKAILLNSPNNPSGAVFSRDELKAIADIAVENDLYVISDEIYEKLIYNPDTPHYSIASFGKEIYDRTIVVNGYSKSYSMTGWRVGYTASSKAIADVIGNIQSHQTSNINTLTQKAALAAETGDQKCIEDMRIAFEKRMELMYSLISEISGLNAVKPDGAFYVFADISALCGKTVNGKTINDASDFAELILDEQKVALVPCADFGYKNHIRLSYACSEEEIKEGMRRIKGFVSGLK